METISRRDFMKAATAATAATGFVGPGVAATAQADEPPAPDGASADAAAVPAGEPITSGTDWLGEAPVVDDADIAQTIDTEFLVIGMGNSGLFAARKAAEPGTQVVVMEKLPRTCGAPSAATWASSTATTTWPWAARRLTPRST